MSGTTVGGMPVLLFCAVVLLGYPVVNLLACVWRVAPLPGTWVPGSCLSAACLCVYACWRC